jgi:hypothetical protein
MDHSNPHQEIQSLSLEAAASHLLEECRMVLPGVQALFGFQFVAVFSEAFETKLSPNEQTLHLVALVSVACAAGLVMSPAALHRRSERRVISEAFIAWSSRLLAWSMAPLALGTALDVYLVARLITHSPPRAAGFALGVLLVFTVLWLIVPRWFPRATKHPAQRAAG